MIARLQTPHQAKALFSVSVCSNAHQPYFWKGETLTVDPNLTPREGDFCIVEIEGGMVLCRASADRGSYREVSRHMDGPKIQGESVGRVVKREAVGSGVDGVSWPLPLMEESHGMFDNAFPRFDPNPDAGRGELSTKRLLSEESLSPFVYGGTRYNAALALAAQEEGESDMELILLCAELKRSPMAALVFQDFARDCGAPENTRDFLVFAARMFRAGEIAGERLKA